LFGVNFAHLCAYTIQAHADAIQEAIDLVFRPPAVEWSIPWAGFFVAWVRRVL